MLSKRILGAAAFAVVLSLASCTSSRETRAQRDVDANSPAGKVGQAAHHAADKLNEAAAKANRDLRKAAHQAKAGWDQAARDDKKDHH